MPYRKRTVYRKRPAYRKRASPVVKREIARALRKDNAKDHPLQWVDVHFNGEYVKTSPVIVSFTQQIMNAVDNNNAYQHWPLRTAASGSAYREAPVYITGVNWQIRYQQNEQAADPTTDTVRTVMYSFDETIHEDSTPIFNGGDIDSPPNTKNVQSMYMDKIFQLKGQTTETTGDDTEFVPGQRITKGFKKLNHKFMIQEVSDTLAVLEGGDIRQEHISDDNSTIGEVECFGFLRIYYRVMA